MKDDVVSPADGTLMALEEISDPLFAEGAMGTGFGVTPEHGEIVSPVGGVIKEVFPTRHAILIFSNEGTELLVHMGIGTMRLNGEPFEIQVKPGDSVTAGQRIAVMDLEAVKAHGCDTTIAVIFTSVMDRSLVLDQHGKVHCADPLSFHFINKLQ